MHIMPQYLPQLQSELFERIDKLGPFFTEEDFLDMVTVADISMIALHLPFDGSGRAIEDFFVYLGEKYNFPLTISVLGYRAIGSPILDERDEAATELKKQINKAVLGRLGMVANPNSDDDAITRVKVRFNCNQSLAEKVFNSEKALFTSRVNSAVSDPEKSKEIMALLPASLRLRENWQEARKSRFFEVPDKYKVEVDSLAALIGSTKDNERLGWKIGELVADINKIVVADNLELDEIHTSFLIQVGNVEAETNVDLLPEMVQKLRLTIDNFDDGELDRYRYSKLFADLFYVVLDRVSGRKVFDEVFKRIDALKIDSDSQIRTLGSLIEVYALEKVNLQKGRNKDDLLFQIFPNIKGVIENAAKFGSVATKIKAGTKLSKLRNSNPKFVEWKKTE